MLADTFFVQLLEIIAMGDAVVRLMCPNLKCRCILAVPASARGKSVRCRNCGTNVRVPTPPPAPAAPAAPAKDAPGK
jgi:hypothetical protein